MKLETRTSLTLKYSIYVGVLIMVAGLIINAICDDDRILWTGLLILIVSPLMGVVVSTVTLIQEKDRYWVTVALILVAISVINILMTVF